MKNTYGLEVQNIYYTFFSILRLKLKEMFYHAYNAYMVS
jgi:tRNA(Glu) U13 pseudouridine synthase TruD